MRVGERGRGGGREGGGRDWDSKREREREGGREGGEIDRDMVRDRECAEVKQGE